MLSATSLSGDWYVRHAIVVAVLVHSLLPHVYTTTTISKVQCEVHNGTWITVNDCSIRQVRRGKASLSVNVTLLKSANEIHVNGLFSRKTNKYTTYMFNQSIDACKFYHNRKHPLANFIYQAFEQHASFNHACPYEGIQYVTGLELQNKFMDMPIPNGEYALNLTWLFYRMKVLSTTVVFNFESN